MLFTCALTGWQWHSYNLTNVFERNVPKKQKRMIENQKGSCPKAVKIVTSTETCVASSRSFLCLQRCSLLLLATGLSALVDFSVHLGKPIQFQVAPCWPLPTMLRMRVGFLDRAFLYSAFLTAALWIKFSVFRKKIYIQTVSLKDTDSASHQFSVRLIPEGDCSPTQYQHCKSI